MLTSLIEQISEDIVDTIREPLLILDQDLRVTLASRSFYDFFKVKPEETVGQLIYDLGNKQWDIRRLRELLETILPEKTSFDDYEVEHDFAIIGRHVMLLNARQIERGVGEERIILLAIEDITERIQLKDVLTESLERYRKVFETSTDGILLFEKGGLIIRHANQSIEVMLGYSKEEIIGKDLNDIGFPDDIGSHQEIVQTLKAVGILHYKDARIIKKTGQVLDADIYMVDRASLVQCNVRDVSERKKTEKILEEEKKFIENALNTLQDIFFVFDLEGRFIRWNKTMNAVTGYTDNEISLKKVTDFFHEEEKERVSKAILKGIEEGSASVEAIIITKDGRQMPYAFNAAILTNAQ
jgi:PAS domain S-box-containing protein